MALVSGSMNNKNAYEQKNTAGQQSGSKYQDVKVGQLSNLFSGGTTPVGAYNGAWNNTGTTQTAYQSIQAKPKAPQWTVGMPPTTAGQAMTSILDMYNTDPVGAERQLTLFNELQNTPGNMFYNPFAQASNKAVKELQQTYGIDTSLLTDDWFNNNHEWESFLRYNGNTNTPSAPTKKSSEQERLAYQLYQFRKSMGDTKQAKDEWQALQEETAYWAMRDDLNLSEDEIINKYIDWSKYKTLEKMYKTRDGNQPMELNEAIGYSRENLLGTIWAARNGGTSGNAWYDLAHYYNGDGNTWQANEEIAKKLDVNSDDYSPYEVSMTLNKMGAYFGVKSFPKGWVQDNAWRLGSSDETEVENFRTVAEAEEKTVSAETELENLKGELDRYMKSERNPAEVEKFMQGLFDKGKYPTLRGMDQSIRTYSKRGDLVGTTRPVDFSWDGMLGYINDELEKKKNTPDGDKILEPFWQNPHNLNPTYKTKIGKPTRIGGSGEGVIGSRQQASAAPAAEQPAATAPSTGTTQPVTVTPPAWDTIGQFGAGNIDLYNRPEYVQTDGSVSTVNSICFTDDDGKVVLIPTIVDGKQVSDDEAYDHYVRSGEFLGKFDSVEDAVGYSQKLHKQQERLYGGPRTKYDVREEAMDLLEGFNPEGRPGIQMTVDPTGGSVKGLNIGDPAKDSLTKKFARYTEQADKWAEAAYDAVYGEGAYATDMELASGPAGVPGFEPEREKTGEQRLEDEKNSTAARTAATLQDEMTESEKGFFDSGIGVQNDRIRERTLVGPLNPAVWEDKEFASRMMYTFAENREKKYRKGAMDSLYLRTTYEKNQKELDELDEQIAAIEADADTLYASRKDLGDEVYVKHSGISAGITLTYNEGTGRYEWDAGLEDPEVYNGLVALIGSAKETEDWIAETANRMTEERNRILDAKSRLGDLSVDEKGNDNTKTLDNVSRQLDALRAKREVRAKYISENLDAYNQAMDDINLAEKARVSSATRMYDLSGADSFTLSHQTDNVISYVSAFTDYEGRTATAVPLHSQIIDSMTDWFNNPELVLSDEMIMDFHTKVDELNDEIADVRFMLDSHDDIPENYRKWMEQYEEDLAYQKRQYKYVFEFSDPNLQAYAEEGKDKMAYGMELGFSEEFAKNHGFIADTFLLMEPYEKDLMFALYGKYGYEEAWNYYHDIEESLQIRFGEETQKYASWLAEKGAGGRALALLNSIGLAGADVVASAMQIGKVLFTGEGSGWLSGFTNISKQMMGAINEELEKTYGKDTVQTKVLEAIYSMVNNRGRSLMVGDTFGGIFPSGANEAIHAIPIALVAGADTLTQAIENGAEPWQAWTLFGVTVFAESVTEAIEFKNIKGSIELGGISGKEAFKEFIRGYIPEAMGEVVGESMNDIIEDAADYWVMGGESDFQKNVDKYIELGYYPDEAEEMAFKDEIGKVLYTATVSFFSHGLDLGGVAYGAVSSYSYYNQQVQQLRKNGDARTTVRDLRNRDSAAIRFAADIKKQAEDAELNRDLRSFDFSQMSTMYQQNGPSTDLPAAGEAETTVTAQPVAQTETQTEAQAGQTVQAEPAVSTTGTEVVPSEEVQQGPTPAEQRAAVMEAIGQTRGDYEAQMAAASTETLVRLLGGDQDAAIDIIRSTLEAAGSDASASVVRRAMLYAGLSEHSKARRAITSEVFRQATPEERARMLMETASGDRADTKNAKAWREVIDAVQTFNDTEAVRLRAEEERAAREAETAARQAQAENGTVYEAEQAEKPTTYDLAIAAMANADNSDQNAVHATVAAVLGVNESDGSRASAAANALLGMLGDKTTDTISVLMGGGRKADVNINTLKVGLQYAALADGACRQVMNSDEFKNASPEDQARMLGNAVINDARNNDVQAQVESGVHDYRVKAEEMRLMSEGAGQEAVDAENAANNTRRKTQEAEDLLGERQADVEAKGEAVKAAGEQAAADPSDENTRAAAQATDELNRATESENQYEQHLENQQAEQRKADEAADQAKKTAMNNVRQQAEANVAQVEAQEAQARQEAEERARIAQEEAEKARIEEDKQTGKFQEDWEDSIIESILDDEGLEDGTERDERREALREQRDKIKLSKIDLGGSVTTTEGALAVAAFGRKLGVQIKLADMAEGVRGSYDNGVIYLNKAMVKSGNMAVGQALVEAALHEITHSMEDTGAYQDYRDIVLEKMFNIRGAKNAKTGDLYNANGEFRAAIDALIKERSEAGDKLGGKDLNPEHDREIKIARAEKEIIADFARENLAEKDVIQRFMDAGLSGTMRNTLHNINQALKNFFHRQDTKKIEQWNATHPDEQIDIAQYYKDAEYLRRAERAYQRAMNQVAKASTHPEGGQLSIAQVAQAAGMRFDAEKMVLYDKNGDEINGVSTKIKISDMVETPVGFLIRTGLNMMDGKNSELVGKEDGYIDPTSSAGKALDMMTGLMNMIARYRDSDLVWEIGASTLSSTFSALKGNSDTQYKTTVDFGTICAKTQAIVDVMSRVMMDKIDPETGMLKEGMKAGLTRKDIMTVYNATHNANLSVPCPVCYVFSRWMGVPSLLGQMSQFQKDYVVTKKDENGKTLYDKKGNAVIDWAATQAKVDDYLYNKETGMLVRYKDKDAVNDRKTSLNNKLKAMDDKRAELEVKARETKNEEEKAKIQEQIDAVLSDMVKVEDELAEVRAYNWIDQALCNGDGKFKVDQKNFRLTPDAVIFDMNRTGEFAEYSKNWSFRTTRGAGMGKAIMPYSGETIGDILKGGDKGKRQSAKSNPWLNYIEGGKNSAAIRQRNDARKRARQQNLLGGQRMQSTSDFRPEWGLDYIMSFLELQAAGSNVQMYTKVAEAVDFFASVGADVNLSIMGQGTGWHEATAEELSKMSDEEKAIRVVKLKDKQYIMDFSDITGMKYWSANPDERSATSLKNKYNNVQMILVGMNDTHIRLALANDNIDFVIPWHSSGNSKEILSGLISSVGEKLDRSVDYTTTQSDMRKGETKTYYDEDGNKVKYSAPGKQTEDEKKIWDLRMRILTGKANETEAKGGLTAEERKFVYDDEWLGPLYERFYVKGKDDACYGVKLSSKQANQIFPYEYWDTSLTKDKADENGERFVKYCERMGIIPRFSQFKDDPGYWKLLIDRPMYNLDGTYHKQQTIDVTQARIGELDESGKLDKSTSDLPTQARAAYAPKDPRSPMYEEYKGREEKAVQASEEALGIPHTPEQENAIIDAENLKGDDPYDPGMDAQMSVLGGQTDADRLIRSEPRNSAYLDAVDRGDMDVAQKMVDDAAKEAGYNLAVFHGTGEYFNTFERGAEGIHLGNMEQASQVADQRYETRSERTQYRWGDIRDSVGDMNTEQRESLLNQAYIMQDYFYDGNDVDPFDGDISDTAAVTAYVEGIMDRYAKSDEVSPDDVKIRFRTFDRKTGSHVMNLYAKMNNPFTFSGDIGQWTPDRIASTLMSLADGNNEISDYYTTIDLSGSSEIQLSDEQKAVLERIAKFEISGDEAWDALSDTLGEIGYDGIKYLNTFEGDKNSYSYLALKQSDVKSADPVTYDDNDQPIPITERFNMGSTDTRYSEGGNMTDADRLNQTLVNAGVVAQEDVDAYNALRVDQGQRQFGYKTVQDVEGVSQQVKDYLKSHSIYNKDTNDAQINRAVQWAMSKRTKADPTGFWAMLEEIESKNFNPLTADGQARMYVAMSLAAGMKDSENSIIVQKRIADAINKQGTTIGQALQARKLYRLMTPVGRISVLQKEVDNVNAELRKAGKEGNVTLSEWITLAAAGAQTEKEFADAQMALWQELGAQMPVTWFERLQAWRMVSMLGNPRTHVRNIIGNLGFMPMVAAKNKIGAAMESMFLGEGEKTKAFVVDKDALEWASADAERMKDVLTGEAKYSDKTKMARFKRPFGSSRVGKAIQAWSDYSGNKLEAEDWWFLERHYRNSLAGWMTANNVTGEMLEKDSDLMDRAQAYAIEEAQKATYRDASAVADALGKLDKVPGLRYFSTAILPFKRTPTNIMKRGIEYSPVGLLKALTVDSARVIEYNKWASGKKKEKADWAISPAQYIDKISSGIVGTGVAMIGGLLKKLGILSLGFKKDDPEDKFKKAEGQQEYAINFKLFGQKVSFTIDWAVPASMSLFVGAAIEEACENNEVDFGSIIEGLGTITEPYWNLSMLDGVNSIFQTSQFEDLNVGEQIIMKVATNYVSSFIPSVVGAFSRIIDPVRRKAFVPSGSKPSSVLYSIEQMQNKLPFSVWNIPYRDHRGKEDRSTEFAKAIENLVNPGYLKITANDETLNELHRLYTDNKEKGIENLNSVVPSDADKYFSYKGKTVRLTDKQYDQMDVERKEIGYELLDKLMADPYYASVDDKARIDMIQDIWLYATQQAKYNQFPDFDRADWVSRTEKNKLNPLDVIKSRSNDKMLSDQKDGWSTALVDAIKSGDRGDMNMARNYLKGLDLEDKDIEKIVKSEFLKEYQQAYKNDDRDTMQGIQAMLRDAGFAFDFDEWLKNTKKTEDEWLESVKPGSSKRRGK